MAVAPNGSSNVKQEPLTRATGFVTIASKLPLPLILRVDEMREVAEPVMGGGSRLVKMAEKKAEVRINGVATRFGELPSCRIIGGYALTPNISAEFWEKWLSENAESDLIRNGIVFAYEKPEDVKDCAKDGAKVLTGIEPLMQEGDPRADKRIEKGERA